MRDGWVWLGAVLASLRGEVGAMGAGAVVAPPMGLQTHLLWACRAGAA